MDSWIVVTVTLFFSALCSGLEIAFNSINRLQLEVELTKTRFRPNLSACFSRASRDSSPPCFWATTLRSSSMA